MFLYSCLLTNKTHWIVSLLRRFARTMNNGIRARRIACVESMESRPTSCRSALLALM